MNARPDPGPLLRADPQPARDPMASRHGMPILPMPVHDARHLTGPDGQARIVLDGQVYSLRITRAGKLILTK